MRQSSGPMMLPGSSARHWLPALEALFDRAFDPRGNPWRHLGALSFYLFWIIAVTGIYLYAVFLNCHNIVGTFGVQV